MRCPYCGKELDREVRFCPYCGKEQSGGSEENENAVSQEAEPAGTTISHLRRTILIIVIIVIAVVVVAGLAVFLGRNHTGTGNVSIRQETRVTLSEENIAAAQEAVEIVDNYLDDSTMDSLLYGSESAAGDLREVKKASLRNRTLPRKRCGRNSKMTSIRSFWNLTSTRKVSQTVFGSWKAEIPRTEMQSRRIGTRSNP